MNTKDIKIGEEYAVQAPNAARWRGAPARARVVKVGVYGRDRDGLRTTHANYIEIEGVDNDLNNTYRVLLNVNGRMPGRYEHAVETFVHYRCQASHVLKPWAEHEAKVADTEAYRAREREERAAEQTERDAVAKRFEALGVHVGAYDRNIQLTVADAKLILAMIEKKS